MKNSVKTNIKQIFPVILQGIQYLFNIHVFLAECDNCKTPSELWKTYHKYRGEK